MSLRSLTPLIHVSNAFTPLTPSGLTLWLDGADPAGTGTPPTTGTGVTTWVDKSTSGFNFAQAGSTTPTYQSNQHATKGAIQTVGSGFYTLNHTLINSGLPFTLAYAFYLPSVSAGVFPVPMIIQGNTSTPFQVFYSGSGAYQFMTTGTTLTGGWMGITWSGGTWTYGTWNIFILTYNGSGSTTIGNYAAYINNTTATATAQTGFGNATAGSHNWIFTDNDGDPCVNTTMIQNICLYNNVLSAPNISSLYTYLATVGG